ncbi:hypothetical protein LPJ75_001754 [Coemansia sp. RSA 2598]|nr:hypothetical protein LPJ75_001754 [Coemansia sp. RSA 2598]
MSNRNNDITLMETAHQSNSLCQPESTATSLANWTFGGASEFNNAFPLNPDVFTNMPHRTTSNSTLTLTNKPMNLDIETYFSDKSSILYDKKTKKLKDKAPNAFMIYRLSQIKDLKGKRYTPVFINNAISAGWASLHQEERALYLWLSRSLQRRLDIIRCQGRASARHSKKRFGAARRSDAMKKNTDDDRLATLKTPKSGECSVLEINCNGKLSQLSVFPQDGYFLNTAETTAAY